MDLKKMFKNTALCLAIMGVSYSALATDATLNITGTVKASPCTVVADDASGNINVDLGTNLQAASFAAGGSSAWVPFTLSLTDCPTSTTSVVAAFTGTQSDESADLYKNTGDAGSVQVELQSTAGANLGNGKTMTATVVTATNAASFPLQARAYSTAGNVTPGSIVGTVQVAFTYQ